MQVWNVLHVACGKQDAKIRLCTIAQLCWAISSQLLHYWQSEKNMLNSNISSTQPTSSWGWLAGLGCHQISTGFTSWLHYCTDVTTRRSTKLCTKFGRLLGWYTVYTFSGALSPWRNFAKCRIHFASKSCVLLYWQCYCMALEQCASVKLCVIQQRAPPVFGRASSMMLGISLHSSIELNTLCKVRSMCWKWLQVMWNNIISNQLQLSRL